MFLDWCYFVDIIFELYGYHSMPHQMRYAIAFAVCIAPIYSFLFIWCCIHNEKDSDPFEEAQFLQRYKDAEQRKKEIIAEVEKKFK